MDQLPNPLDPRFGRCPPSPSPSPRPPLSPSPTPPSPSPSPFPPRGGSHHRRAHSETFLHIPDDFLLDSDTDFGLADVDLSCLSSDDNNSSGNGFPPHHHHHAATAATAAAAAPFPPPPESGDHGGGGKGKPPRGAHLRSLSVDAAFFEDMGFNADYYPPIGGAGGAGAAQDGGGGGGVRKGRHRHSSSLDGSRSPFEADSLSAADFAKKAMASDKLAELALVDPNRAKRILANRQSAARSKERKIRYTGELERKVQTLQTEATTLSAQLTILQRDTSDLTVENKELKLRLQAMEQQAQLRDALNEALREEVQRLKIATGQIATANGTAFNHLGLTQQAASFFSHPQQQMNGFSQNQAPQLPNSQPPPPHSRGHSFSGHPQVDSIDSMDFM